ncbi:MAG: EF-Tu/IF-2/RF-3 family GTPase [Candidatus Omnitrophota bacterium]
MGFFDLFKKKADSVKDPGKEKLVEIGAITHYFPHVKAAVMKISKGSIKVGDDIYIKGHTTNFKQAVKSLQVNRAPVEEAKMGQEIGIKVKSRVRIGDIIYKA